MTDPDYKAMWVRALEGSDRLTHELVEERRKRFLAERELARAKALGYDPDKPAWSCPRCSRSSWKVPA